MLRGLIRKLRLLPNITFHMNLRKITRYWLPRILVLAVLAGLGLVAGLWWLHDREVVLPSPGGPYPVGRIETDWTDPSRPDPLEEIPQPARKLNVWIWYPAEEATPPAEPAPYLPSPWVAAREKAIGIGRLLMQNPAHVRAHSLAGPPLSAAQRTYPVILMQPGLGPSIPDYTTLGETLASYGYIVVGSTPTGSANLVVFANGQVVSGSPKGDVPDSASIPEVERVLGKLIQVWAGDDRFVLDQVELLNASDPEGRFTGRIDLEAVGVMGHSFGGATAAQFCRLDSRCKAGADLDGYPYGDVIQVGLRQPFLFVWSEPIYPEDPAWKRAMQATQAIFERLPKGSLQLTIRGARHFNFTDEAVEFQPALHRLGLLGPIDGRYGLEIVTTYVRAFFDEALLDKHDPILEADPSPYPEVEVRGR